MYLKARAYKGGTGVDVFHTCSRPSLTGTMRGAEAVEGAKKGGKKLVEGEPELAEPKKQHLC